MPNETATQTLLQLDNRPYNVKIGQQAFCLYRTER